MARQAQIRRRRQHEPDVGLPPLPRRPISDTRSAGRLLQRIRRVLDEARR